MNDIPLKERNSSVAAPGQPSSKILHTKRPFRRALQTQDPVTIFFDAGLTCITTNGRVLHSMLNQQATGATKKHKQFNIHVHCDSVESRCSSCATAGRLRKSKHRGKSLHAWWKRPGFPPFVSRANPIYRQDCWKRCQQTLGSFESHSSFPTGRVTELDIAVMQN